MIITLIDNICEFNAFFSIIMNVNMFNINIISIFYLSKTSYYRYVAEVPQGRYFINRRF